MSLCVTMDNMRREQHAADGEANPGKMSFGRLGTRQPVSSKSEEGAGASLTSEQKQAASRRCPSASSASDASDRADSGRHRRRHPDTISALPQPLVPGSCPALLDPAICPGTGGNSRSRRRCEPSSSNPVRCNSDTSSLEMNDLAGRSVSGQRLSF